AIAAEVRLYDHLFAKPKPDEEEDWKAALNPQSLTALAGCRLEPSLQGAARGNRYQFERQGYFCVDPVDSTPARLVFNRTVGLRASTLAGRQYTGAQPQTLEVNMSTAHAIRGHAVVVQPEEGASFWQPVPANGHADPKLTLANTRYDGLSMGYQTIAPGGRVR